MKSMPEVYKQAKTQGKKVTPMKISGKKTSPTKNSPFKSSYMERYQSTQMSSRKPSVAKSMYDGGIANQSICSSVPSSPVKHSVIITKHSVERQAYLRSVKDLISRPKFGTFRQDFQRVSYCQFGKEPPFTKRWPLYLSLTRKTNTEELGGLFDLMK